MSVFGGYARYYDLFYREKDYAAESRFVAQRIQQYAPAARELLELGCGSGGHALELARMGYSLTGVDRSEEMLRAAQRRIAASGEAGARVRVAAGDARHCRLGRRYDAVLALFHVVSYQAADADLAAMLQTAAAHLLPGAPFIFDFWFGPAVRAQRPEPRVRVAEDDEVRVTRRATPEVSEARDCVDVRYTLEIRSKRGQPDLQTLTEVHTMRYFFLPELEGVLERSELRLVGIAEMETGAALSEATWSACAIALRR